MSTATGAVVVLVVVASYTTHHQLCRQSCVIVILKLDCYISQSNAMLHHFTRHLEIQDHNTTLYNTDTVNPQLQAGLDIYIEHTVREVSQQRGIGREQSCPLRGTQRQTHQIRL